MKTTDPFVPAARRLPFWPALLALTLVASTAAYTQGNPVNLPPEPAPPIPTKRPPRADEVGPLSVVPKVQQQPPGALGAGITPLPGLPVDTSFDSVCWISQGPGITRDGDLNIAPDHPTSGCVTCLAPHPSDGNTMYIGTANGGVWKTTNALATNPRWVPLTDNELSQSIGGLAIDPNDGTGNTVVAGFGRRSSFGGTGGAQRGLLRSTDGGATWTRIGETALQGRSIYNLAVRGNTFLLAVPSTEGGATGLYRTTDGGTMFTNMAGAGGSGLPAGTVTHLAADPSNLSRFYCHVANTGVYRSTDSGATWTSVSTGMAAASTGNVTLAVAFDGTVFAAEVTGTARVYRSTTQGASWVQMDSIQVNMSERFNSIAADPANSNLVYLAGLFTRAGFPFSGRVVRGNASLAAGSQWTSIASTQGTGVGTAPHTDSRALAFTAGNRLIEGDDGGLYELNIANVGSEGTGAAGGGVWRSINGDLHICEMHSVAFDRVSRIFIGGTQDTAFQEGLKQDVPVAGVPGWKNTSNGDGGDALIDLLTPPAGQSIRYGSSQYLASFFRATYNASNVQQSRTFPAVTLVGGGLAPVRDAPSRGGNMPFVTPLAMNAVAGGRLIISGNNNVYESTDQGNTVTQVDTVGTNQLAKIAYGGKLSGSAVPGVVFYGAGSNIRYRTAASGSVTNSIAFPGGTVQGIVFDPENWKTAYIVGTISGTGTVYSANDIPANGAAAFTNITGNLTNVGNFHTIEYLTLPSGNAIIVGTDLGAYIMRLSSPGAWKTLGDNLPHVLVVDSHFDPVGQVLAISCFGRGAWLYDFKPTKATSQYGETFQAYADGTSTLAAGAGEFFSSHPGTAAKVADGNLRELQLTADGTGNTFTAFRLPNLNGSAPVTAFSAKWNATIYGSTSAGGGLADGFSFNFGPLGGISGVAFINGTYANEDGFGAGLTVSVRTYSGNTPGYYVRVNGAVVPGGFISKPTVNWGEFNITRHFFEVDWRIDTGLTLRVDGSAIFTNLATPGFVPAAGDRFVFGARTGGSDEQCSLDNIAIFTGGVLTPLSATTPYYFSAQNSGSGEGADKAFDGTNAKWLTPDYTGFIGASFSSAKTVRAYTLLSANDFSTRDPAAWDFQTGNDGVLWNQHGAQCEQFFLNRFESRTFVVANSAPNTKFRIHISENHGGNEIQVAEFQSWELSAVAPSFIVTNTNDTGAGSLRQALAASATFPDPSLITFAPGLSGQTITLASDIVAATTGGATIDASALPSGITIMGGGQSGDHRLFTVASGASLTVRGVAFTNGGGSGLTFFSEGGAILNEGSLALTRCTLSGNSGQNGGAIYNGNGTLTLTDCTLSGNETHGADGGTIYNRGMATLTRCTLAGNVSSEQAGAIANAGTITITHCTLANNLADLEGGAIFNTGTLTATHCTISGNLSGDSSGGGIANNGMLTLNACIVAGNMPNDISGTFAGTSNITDLNPLVAPLGDYGGLTQTMALKPGSPARNASVGSAITSDQRGFPIIGTADIGAYEAG
ncbi:MAG TPA: choice-of-anchor Q domain-containing protein, partial [Chthoniobacteraceae bacterium]|nr:choice-of-anchor Q domain-containing protein [Chthoniobacteraceae bacterium]